MRYVVGYTPNERGADAIALASVIARTQGARLDLVYVVGDKAALVQDAVAVKRDALDLVPKGVQAEFHVRAADSFASGLIEAAVEYSALLIVVGAASNGLFKRFTVGSVANALLHASPVPVALAPRGYQRTEPLTRLTAMVGTREGWESVTDVGINAAGRRDLPLRLVSVVELDELMQRHYELSNALSPARQHANTVLTEAAQRRSGGSTTVTLAHGRTIEEAVDSLGWEDGELVIVGSSRLAERRKLFMGATANKILRALPVPMVVVPRDYERIDG
ncbi:universal stress protein [Paenarthrobacter sp. PH39-S1]|uniref:universal stress protein n=1 Tax=Paenarthrobacter sp. PH39-S1 TaxID=3046204 RepID=UPI0024BBE3DF|nr:universal stress protein [Paenarthrobacter sp. PH39-S1]MDJ0355041.1 universal stress protein [Paenarthrobacter sp. PH39-S1]